MRKENCLLTGIVVAAAIIAATPALAQRGGAGTTQPPKKVTLTTDDGVQLAATYYPSSQPKGVPVLMLADHKDSQSVMAQIARRLQSPSPGDEQAGIPADKHQSFAVLTVDLRGHGDSLSQRLPNGSTRQLDAAKLTRQDLNLIGRFDMKAIRKFLVDENDAGRLNLNSLSIIGAGMGAAIAVNWTAFDWSVPPLPIGKQGQDVKALILVSPPWKFRGLTVQQALRQPGVQSEVAVLMLYGKQDRQVSADVKRIYEMLEKHHPRPESAEPGAMHDLMEVGDETRVQGSQLLKVRAAEDLIIDFLQTFVVAENFPWSKRRNE